MSWVPQPSSRPEFQARRVAFGQRVRELRESRGLTQEQVAERAELDVKTISRVENAQGVPDLDRIFALADALDVSGAELLVDDPSSSSRDAT